MIDATQHIKHSTTAIEQTAKASEDSAEPVSPDTTILIS